MVFKIDKIIYLKKAVEMIFFVQNII